MATEATARDADIGLTLLLSLVALGGAVVMYLGAGHVLAGWGFALAMLAAAIAVAAPHVWA